MLVVGIGNSSRGDDGLGWRFVEDVSKKSLPGCDTEYRYQLQIEDSIFIKEYDLIVFVDASHECIPHGFSFTRCLPENSFNFSTHRIDPSSILWLCKELYGNAPEAYVLAIEGKRWGLGDGLGKEAEENLINAQIHFYNWLAIRSYAIAS